jgi:hypothetical protein
MVGRIEFECTPIRPTSTGTIPLTAGDILKQNVDRPTRVAYRGPSSAGQSFPRMRDEVQNARLQGCYVSLPFLRPLFLHQKHGIQRHPLRTQKEKSRCRYTGYFLSLI